MAKVKEPEGAHRSQFDRGPSRRQTLLWFAAGVVGGAVAPRARSQNDLVVSEPWADLVQVGDRAWAVLSKPRGGSFKTLCNGGIVAGADRVLAVDAYAGDEGAEWVIERCRELTGKAPTDVVLSHHHGDHVGGVGAFARAGATVHTTEVIGMDESPVEAVRNKPDSSITRLAEMSGRRASNPLDAIISAGNTGAKVTAAQMYMRRLPGVIRPGICGTMPTFTGPVVFIDVGANIEPKPSCSPS